jgi:hypothetical protein
VIAELAMDVVLSVGQIHRRQILVYPQETVQIVATGTQGVTGYESKINSPCPKTSSKAASTYFRPNQRLNQGLRIAKKWGPPI